MERVGVRGYPSFAASSLRFFQDDQATVSMTARVVGSRLRIGPSTRAFRSICRVSSRNAARDLIQMNSIQQIPHCAASSLTFGVAAPFGMTKQLGVGGRGLSAHDYE